MDGWDGYGNGVPYDFRQLVNKYFPQYIQVNHMNYNRPNIQLFRLNLFLASEKWKKKIQFHEEK